MKVWVVMSNDFPDSVFSTKSSAERYVKDREEEGKINPNKYNPSVRIYWKLYEFELL